MKIPFTGYANVSDESEYDLIEGLQDKYGFKLTDKAFENAANWGYEIAFQLVLDTETGDVEIVGCDGYLIDKTKKLEMK